MDAGETPYLEATCGGRLRAGYSMTGGEPSDNEETGCLSVLEAASAKLRGRRGGGINLVTPLGHQWSAGSERVPPRLPGYSSAGEALRSLRYTT